MKNLYFDLEGIFNLGNEDFYFNAKRRELSICSQDIDLLEYLNKKYGGRIVKCMNFSKLFITGKKSIEFLENHSY